MIKKVTDRTILIVEDDVSLSATLAAYFESGGNEVLRAETLQEAQAMLAENQIDAVVLDLLLPDGEGTELLGGGKKLPPVVILSTLGGEHDMLEGFAAGATDYVVKPCSPALLEARLALRLLPKNEASITLHGLQTDVVSRTVRYKGVPVALTGSEFNILWFLMSHAGRFFDAATLYENVWEMPSLSSTSIKYHISNLRKKIKAAACRDLIVTEFGKGYSFLAGKKHE